MGFRGKLFSKPSVPLHVYVAFNVEGHFVYREAESRRCETIGWSGAMKYKKRRKIECMRVLVNSFLFYDSEASFL